MTIDEAIAHRYFSEFRDEYDKEEIQPAEKISFDYTHKFQLEVALFKEKMMMEMIEKK